ncbi:MAG: hypothetical protein J7D61_14560, partial [Marichromatium sp.]|nr:hypothetical protein [Marichromatium sp.]
PARLRFRGLTGKTVSLRFQLFSSNRKGAKDAKNEEGFEGACRPVRVFRSGDGAHRRDSSNPFALFAPLRFQLFSSNRKGAKDAKNEEGFEGACRPVRVFRSGNSTHRRDSFKSLCALCPFAVPTLSENKHV